MSEPHHCHAHGCDKSVPPRLMMCPKHWRMVPVDLQSRVWRTYRRGQENDKKPSESYILVQRSCVWAVFVAEGGCEWPEVPEVGSMAFMIGPRALKKGTPNA